MGFESFRHDERTATTMIRRARRSAFLCIAVLVMLGALVWVDRAGGTVMQALSLPRMTQASQLAVVGTVTGRSAGWRGGWIVTRSEVLVERIVHNELERTPMRITVTTLGGETEGRGLWVPGEAYLRPGCRYLLFTAESVDHMRLVAMAQSALPVVQTDQGQMVMPPAALGLVSMDDGTMRPALPFLTQPQPLEGVIARIQASAQEPSCTD